jgi:hypothetical protein
MPRLLSLGLVALVVTAIVSACSSGSGGSGKEPTNLGTDAAIPEAGKNTVDAFNGDCTSARWADVSDACWSCQCGACKQTLDACNIDCVGVLACALDHHTLANVGSDVTCEIRATVAECLKDPKSQAVASPLTQFDACLIGAHTTGHFRACEDECKISYTGDVCQRYPATPPADGG